jgi:ubiquinone/menaquinone biosynthesis C-methylase UbiE
LFARWNVMQKWQFEAICSIGLQPHNRILDIGCGVFRFGMVAVPFLESNCYFGTDPVPAYLETARNYATSVLKTSKKFQLLLDHTFEFDRFEKKFDFAMAHSVFTHMSSHEIEQCLRSLARVMEPGGKLLFTIALQPKLLEDYQEAFVYNAQIPMVRSYHSSINLYTKLAQEIGFTFEELLEPNPY